MQLVKFGKPAAIEELIFKVKPEFVDEFLKIDHEIWTAMLSSYPGFESKEVWVSKTNPGEITQVIYWSDYDLWKAIPEEDLMRTQKEFDEAVGVGNYEWIGAPHDTNQKYRIMEYK